MVKAIDIFKKRVFQTSPFSIKQYCLFLVKQDLITFENFETLNKNHFKFNKQ